MIRDNLSQQGIASAIRASLLSAFSFFENFFIALVNYFWGILLEKMDPSLAIMGLGVFMIAALVVIWWHNRMERLAEV